MAHISPFSPRSVLEKEMNAYFRFYLAYKTVFKKKKNYI